MELASAVAHQYWGMGFATETASAALVIGFQAHWLDNIVLLVDAANTPSRRVAEKLGFDFERNTLWKSVPAMLYRLKRREFSAQVESAPAP